MNMPITVTASTLREIAATEEPTVRYEARTNATGEWAPVNAWSVISEDGAGPIRSTYTVTTPGDALAAFMRQAERCGGMGTVSRIIPDPTCYTLEIRGVPAD